MLDIDYEMKQVTLTAKTIKQLTIINPRKLHQSQINSIYKSLLKHEHFDSNFVVNENNGKTKVIDGNHRIAALILFFEMYPHEQIQVYFATYKDLTEEQERQIFTRWNISITQSTDDFINSYKDTIPTYPYFISELPCSVYGSHSKMKIRDLVNAYAASFEEPYHGGESKTKMELIKYIQRLRKYDVEIIVKNFTILKEIFDKDDAKDWRNLAPFKNIIFRALYYLIANNVDKLGENYVKRRMTTVLSGRTLLDDFRRYSGRRASVDAYHTFKNLLNDADSDKKFGENTQEQIKNEQSKEYTTYLQNMAKKRTES